MNERNDKNEGSEKNEDNEHMNASMHVCMDGWVDQCLDGWVVDGWNELTD